jgi:hypothetical protein
MLKRLLALIAASDGVTSVDGLARTMGVSRALVEQLIADLTRSGHLRLARDDCAKAACSQCPVRSDCEPATSTGLWELTKKGRRSLAKPALIDRN